MTPCTFENLDITVHDGQPPYLATFRYREQSAQGTFDQDISSPAWATFIQEMEETNTATGASVPQLGDDLFQALVRGPLRDLWVTAQSDLDRGHIPGLRVRLMIQPSAVAALPWEFLRNPERRRTLAADSRTPLVRMETQHRYIGPTRALATQLPLTLLLALPDDPTGRLDSAAEEAGIRQALAKIPGTPITLETIKGTINVLDLRRALEQKKPDILHIVTHGSADGLLFWQDDAPTVVQPASLRAVLDWARSVKLVVLNACQSGQTVNGTHGQPPLASFGAQVLQSGVPAVIAMQFPISDQAAIQFSELLYTGLVDGPCVGRVDSAVGYARSGLFALDTTSANFGTPVLWLNSQDGVIFELQQQAEEKPLEDGASPPTLVPNADSVQNSADQDSIDTAGIDTAEPAIAEIDIAEMDAWINKLLARDTSSFSTEQRLLAIQQRQFLTLLASATTRLSELYTRRDQGDYVSARIRRLESTFQEQKETVQRLETIIQANLD